MLDGKTPAGYAANEYGGEKVRSILNAIGYGGRRLTVPVWRICTTKGLRLAAPSYGSPLAPGRSHLSPADGLPVVCAGSSRAICQLEKRVHCNGVKPVGLVRIRLDLPDDGPLQDVRSAVGLTEHWSLQESRPGSASNGAGRVTRSPVGSFDGRAAGEQHRAQPAAHRAFGDIVVTMERDPFDFDPRMF